MNRNNTPAKGLLIAFGLFFFFIFFVSSVGEFIFLIMPIGLILLIGGGITFAVYKESKRRKSSNREFDYSKSYYNKIDVNDGLLESKRLEENYLKERNYNVANENTLFYERKTTEFDKAHHHENMYPDSKEKKIIKKNIKSETKVDLEEQIKIKQNHLKELKKSYNDFQIGLIEFNELQNNLKEEIKQLRLELEKGEQN